MAAVKAQVLFAGAHHPAQNHGFSHIVQHRRKMHVQLVKHPVSQALKTDHINIHHAVFGMKPDHLPLGLHGKLLRHNDQIAEIRLLYGAADCLLIKIAGFARSCFSKYKLQRHVFSLLSCLMVPL